HIERLNETVNFLGKLKRNNEAEKLTLDFYARMIELEQLEIANFIGLAKQYFKLGNNEKAIQILQKLSDLENFRDYESVAKIFTEFEQNEKAIEIRQKLAEISPNNQENKFELAKLLPKENSISLLQNLIDDRNTLRDLRWRAIWKLRELGENVQISDSNFDTFSQFYNGLLFNDENYFINSLIADDVIKHQCLQQLIKTYAQSNKPLAALKLAEIDKSEKSFELLELLSKTAENVGEFNKAIEFEKAKSKIDESTIERLKLLETEQNTPFTDFTIDTENTRKL
ncbi:MAG: hypothetical protein MUC29_06350, partial [Pyrinomonadaceae bacterium]|nr:hypothetical protein [Pyrinomonadaceae bacterium]